MEATILRTRAQIRELQLQWGGLKPSTPFACWDYAHDWLHSVPDVEPFVIAIRSGGRLIALAPWCVVKEAAGVRTVTGISGNSAWYHDPLLHPSADPAAVARAMARALHAERWDSINLILQPQLSEPFMTELKRLGMAVIQRVPEDQGHVIQFGDDWDEAWNRFPSTFRKNMARRVRRLNSLPHRFLEATASNAGEWLEELIRLYRLRWQTDGNWEPTFAFMRANTETLLQQGELRLFALEIHGRLAAFDYHVRKRNRAYSYMCAYQEEFASYSPGTLLMSWSLAHLHREGVRAIDLGPGLYAWKEVVENTPVETLRLMVGGSPRGMALLGWRTKLKPWLLQRKARQAANRIPAPGVPAAEA